MSNNLRTGVVVAGMVGVFLIASFANNGVTESETASSPSKQAVANTEHQIMRESFVKGCMSEGANREECTCSLNGLESLYPDFYTNEERWERMDREGLNQEEAGLIIECVDWGASGYEGDHQSDKRRSI